MKSNLTPAIVEDCIRNKLKGYKISYCILLIEIGFPRCNEDM